MGKELFLKIKKLLDENKVEYDLFEHEHVHTSEDAAKVRGTKIEQAAKAIIIKTKSGKLAQFVLGGDKRIDLKVIKKELLHEKNVSLASPEDVLQVSGCTIGSVPPFAQLFDKPTPQYFDKDLLDSQEFIVFSAGTHHDSIKMKSADFVKVNEPIVEKFSKEKE